MNVCCICRSTDWGDAGKFQCHANPSLHTFPLSSSTEKLQLSFQGGRTILRQHRQVRLPFLSSSLIAQSNSLQNKSVGQQRSRERKGKSRGTQRGIREKKQEKKRIRTGKKQKVKKGRKHRKEEQGERKNQPGQGDSAQEQREEEKAATEGEVLREDA